MSAYLTSLGKETEINRGSVHDANEHAKIDLTGLKPGSTIQTKMAGASGWICRTRANEYGECKDFLKETGLHSLPGEYEVRCQGAQAELNFEVKLSSELTEKQIDRMISELANPELRLKVENKVSTRVPELREEVKVFGELWGRLAGAVLYIKRAPSETLEPVQTLLPANEAKRLNPADIMRNLLEYKLVRKDRVIRTKRLIWAEKLAPTADNAENVYVVGVIKRFTRRRAVLSRQVADERRRLADQKSDDRSSALDVDSYAVLFQVLGDLAADLDTLSSLTIPQGWEHFKSNPSRFTNRVRYDPHYQQVARLADQLEEKLDPRDTLERETALNSFGRRHTWQLYEYWVLRSVYACLRDLHFEDDDGPPKRGAEVNSGFRKFENIRGGEYGLLERKSVVLRHRKVPTLEVKLTFQPSWLDKKGRKFIPDISLELLGDAHYPNARKLFLDAKCVRLKRNDYTKNYLAHSARRYRDACEKEAMAFLVNLGVGIWPNKNDNDEKMLTPEDQDFRIGVIKLDPSDFISKSSLQRLLTAWLCSSECIAVCATCGEGLEHENTERLGKPKPVNFRRPAQTGHSFRCKTCGTGVTINHCRSCGRGQLVFKIYPRDEQKANKEWNRRHEICKVSSESHQMRICPKCGNSGQRQV